MATIYHDADADPSALAGQRIAVLGFGSQGHAHAQNLKDSGHDVRVGLREGSGSWSKAEEAGLSVRPTGEAVAEADVVMVVLPDTAHGAVYASDVAPNLKAGDMLMFAHGFSVHFGTVKPPADVDVTMIAPKGPGHLVRRTYEEGIGTPALVAVQQDATGNALRRALAYGAGIGAARAGILQTTFKEETETDLFGEQSVLCGGISTLVEAGFDTLVQAGYQPEIAYFECLHELKLIIDLIYEGGLSWMRYSISDTAEWGDYLSGPRIVDEGVRERMRQVLAEIQDGTFAEEWLGEAEAGFPHFLALRREARGSELEQRGPRAASDDALAAFRGEGGPRMTNANDPDVVRIFDTTLRDGEQAPGIALTRAEKVEIAEQLARLEVDVIEAGFPVSSEGEFEAVSEIASSVKGPVIAALARVVPGDITRAAEALAGAERWRIHTFISTSDIHMTDMLRMSNGQVLDAIREGVKLAVGYTEDVEFSAQDATRTELDFLLECFRVAVDAGATTINVPDTVGYAMPHEFGELVRTVREAVPDHIVISTHCHNDLGLAVANSLAGIVNGARQVEVAVNGIGERAGNCSLEEVAMIVRTRREALGVSHGLNLKEIVRTSRLVSMTTGYGVQPNKAVVGSSAFAHESGIHQHGVLANRATYEIMDPLEIGLEGNQLVLGKHSGRHAFADALEKIGIELDEDHLNRAFARFKELADRKIQLTDQDLAAIVSEELGAAAEDVFVLEALQVGGGTALSPTASVRLRRGEEMVEESAMGDGMIDAAMGAIQRASGVEGRLVSFNVSAVTGGTDALGDVVVQLDALGRRVTGRGVATDVVEASARAYLAAVNRAMLMANLEAEAEKAEAERGLGGLKERARTRER